MSERSGGSGGIGKGRRGGSEGGSSRRYESTSRTYGRPRPDQGKRGDVAFRRALVVTLLSVIAPGSGHLALRRHGVGRPVLRTYLILVAAGVLAAIFVPRSWWLALAFKPWVLGALQVAAVVVGVLWVAVVLHAFALARPGQIVASRRGVAVAIALVLCAGILAPFGVASRYAGVQRDLVTSMFPEEGTGPKGRMNVLLIGGDAGKDRVGVRTDSMIVASVDLATGRTVLISLPRNLQHVPMPEGPARDRFPNGFDDLLNAVYKYGEEHPKVVPGSRHPGPDLLKQTVGGVLGIPVHYYLLVNLRGFRQMVDALGGVTVTVKERLPIGGEGGPVTGYVQPGRRKLTGLEALWYARSRAASSDYDRMARQRCLISAVAEQADPANVLLRYQKLAAASKELFATDIPQNVMSSLTGVAEKVKTHKIKSLALVPPLIDTSDPDWGLIKRRTDKAIKASMKDPKPRSGDPTPAGSKDRATPKPDRSVSPYASCD
ncbi:MAG: LytR family transcriptional regulator [Streptosporangiales bacterium]|nr:LytR family transcriptional regulator [Streptosporangiales bacterium]